MPITCQRVFRQSRSSLYSVPTGPKSFINSLQQQIETSGQQENFLRSPILGHYAFSYQEPDAEMSYAFRHEICVSSCCNKDNQELAPENRI